MYRSLTLFNTMITPETHHELTIHLPHNVVPRIAELHPEGLESAVYQAIKVYGSLGLETVQNAEALAKKNGVSVSSLIRESLKLVAEQLSEVTPSNAPKGGGRIPSKVLERRNAAIYERHKAGDRQAKLAAEYKLSLVRITQIVASERAKRDPQTLDK
jgi:hypothetical protein